MTDRAQPGGTLPNACPFLALEDDRDRRSAVPDGRHRCYAESTPLPRALTYQESFCLSAAFPSCRSFLDWAARAAAEPVHGGSRDAGLAPLPPIPAAPLSPMTRALSPTSPLAPIPAGSPASGPGGTAPGGPAAPGGLGVAAAPTGPTGPAVPFGPVGAAPAGSTLLPPPPTYAPSPTWQPPGAARPDPAAYPWASPPPWVSEPDMRSTASLPSSARPPLDPERPDWGTTQSADPWLSEDPTPPETWPPAPPAPTQVIGTFGARRGVEWLDPAGTPDPGLGSRMTPPAAPAPVVATNLFLTAPSVPPAASAPVPVPHVSDPLPTIARGPGAPAPGAPAPATASLTASPAVASGAASWPPIEEDPSAWPARPGGPATWAGEPVAIPVGEGPARPAPTWAVAHDHAPQEPAPPVAPAPPGAPPPAPPDSGIPADSPGSARGRRQPSSRWLPSFLSRDGASGEAAADAAGEAAAGAAVVARTGPAAGPTGSPGASGPTAQPGEAAVWSVTPGLDPIGDDPSETWSDASAPLPWPPVLGSDHPDDPEGASVTEPDSWAVDATGSRATMGPAEAVPPEDPLGALAPRRRRRPGVPVDSNAPASVGAQTSAVARPRGSGEWNRSRRQGVPRIIPGVIPPVAIGAVVLFLAAAFLFLVPGFFAGGGATPTPSLATDVPAVVDVSVRPVATHTPAPSEPPTSEFDTYTVKGGDTLGAIARRFSVTQEQLICVNRELRRNPNLLTIGQALQIPPADYECPAPSKTKKP